MNGENRDWDASQRAIVLAKAKDLVARFREEAEERQQTRTGKQPGATLINGSGLSSGGTTRQHLAEIAGVGEATIRRTARGSG
jgi:hypothetical protein